MIRNATVSDIKAIYSLLRKHADQGELLPRSLSDLYDEVRDFSVYEKTGSDGIAGTCALHVCWEDLAEIRSLVVAEQFQGQGLGGRLVAWGIAEAKRLGVARIFTLTSQPTFFAKQGFKVISRADLPHKIWADCVKCVKFPDCDETALIINAE